MKLIDALFLGGLQGLTEFLPVSSSGHLVVAEHFLGLGNTPVLFNVLLHIATLAAVVVVFARKIGSVLAAIWRFLLRRSTEADTPMLRFTISAIVATVCTGIIGVLIVKAGLPDNPKVVAAFFIVTGLILILSRFLPVGTKSYGEIGWKQGVVIGVAQGIGALPGISRSGSTITAAMGSGMTREASGEFSFIISIPAIIGALIIEGRHTAQLEQVVSAGVLVVGMVVAFVVGVLSLVALMRIIRSGKLYLFSAYLIPLGIVTLIFA